MGGGELHGLGSPGGGKFDGGLRERLPYPSPPRPAVDYDVLYPGAHSRRQPERNQCQHPDDRRARFVAAVDVPLTR